MQRVDHVADGLLDQDAGRDTDGRGSSGVRHTLPLADSDAVPKSVVLDDKLSLTEPEPDADAVLDKVPDTV